MKKGMENRSNNNRAFDKNEWVIGEVRLYRLKHDVGKVLRGYKS
ncbi:MAG TPA: hypothetical protein VIH57_08440 [Bacteroidales bacterium]